MIQDLFDEKARLDQLNQEMDLIRKNYSEEEGNQLAATLTQQIEDSLKRIEELDEQRAKKG